MADALRWQFELTSELVPELQHQTEWVLQRIGESRAPKRASPATRRNHMILSAVLTLALAGIYVHDPRDEDARLYLVCAAVFALVFCTWLVLPRIRRWSTRTAGSLIARRAERMLGGVAKRAPYRVEYELAGEELHTTIEKLGVDRRTALGAAGSVLYTANVVFLCRRPRSRDPLRMVYVPGEPERAAMLAAAARAGLRCDEVTGPITGYAPPIPVARARR